ncbi:MAG: amidohydrolase family protein, partial [Betaproteobacteria bacterium]
FASEEALDLLEAAREHVFVAPTIGATVATLERSADFGRTIGPREVDNLEQELAGAAETSRALIRRGVRVLPGGDYGFAWNPNGANAKDLEHFVTKLGLSPVQAIASATKLGGELMQKGNELGQIKPGFLADLLLVDGDPSQDITLLQNRDRLIGIMKDGVFFKGGDL